jgi:hypothetical protein
VLDQVRSSDYLIWIVALLLYVWDSALLLSPRHLLLVEAGRRRFSTVFSESPFTISGRVLAFSPLVFPYRGAFVAPWGRRWVDSAVLQAALQAVEELRGSLLIVRVLATLAFLLLFVLGPALTLSMGPNAAVVYTAIGVYPTVLTAIVVLWCQRRSLRLTTARAAWLSLDLLVCPAFLPNLVRKITTPQPIEVDGAQVLLATAASDVKEQFLSRLESQTEDLIDDTSLHGPEQEQLRSYLATVKAAR